eukprot:2547984-Pyramimonas_sp.AAC.2
MAEYVNHFAHKNTDRHHFREESSLEPPLRSLCLVVTGPDSRVKGAHASRRPSLITLPIWN